jgi:tetratricopeptide (TPR) repeat protein
MDASYLADDDYDQQTANVVAGAIGLPASAAQSFVGQHRLRQTTDPRAGAFLQKLAQVRSARILITTRLYPWALQLPSGHPRPGCFAYFLRGLSDDDALGLWRALGVSGSRQELVPIFRSVESHPLLVQALASEVANYKKAPGDFAKWRVDHPQFNPASLPLVQSRTHILEFALKGITSKVREVLSMVVGFRMPASYATLDALLVGADKACGSAPELDRALTELEDRGLIGWDREANRYDAHPIVRGVVWQLTTEKDKRAVYTTLEAHFEPMAVPDDDEIETLADLAPAIEHYYTLVGLHRYGDALELFRYRLSDASLYRLAAHRERIAWLEGLFRGDALVLTTEDDESFALQGLAQSCFCVGQLGRAAQLFRRAEEINQRRSDTDASRDNLIDIGYLLRHVGALREAEGALRKTLVLSRKEFKNKEDQCLLQLARVLSLGGDYASGYLAFMRSHRVATKNFVARWTGVIAAYLVEPLLWVGNTERAEALAERAWHVAVNHKWERDVMRAALLQGRVALVVQHVSRADERLHYALTCARAANMVEFELPALIAIAELELQRDRPEEAKVRLDDVWEVVERGPYPLYQADAYNVLAAIARAEGDEPAAIDAATKAYTAAWCDGPPYAYHWGLQKAKAHLAALGAPEPVLPPFDESKFEPLPEVEINPKDEYWVDPDKLDDGLPS